MENNRLHQLISKIEKPYKKKRNIHLYIDTSSGILPEQYQPIVKQMIAIALNRRVSLLVNMFAHKLGEERKIAGKDIDKKKAWEMFLKMEPPIGGSDFKLVWDFINKTYKRRNELSVMITDFGYSIDNIWDYKHPENLYYVPIDKKNVDGFRQIFCNKMEQTMEQKIREHILM